MQYIKDQFAYWNVDLQNNKACDAKLNCEDFHRNDLK